MKLVNLVGQRFGKLVVVEQAKSRCNGSTWVCECDCGNIKTYFASNLKSGHCKSCGCNKGNIIHGMRHSVEWATWQSMKRRCYNPKAKGFQNYGGRGIKVCDRWKEAFLNFFEDVGLRPSDNHSLDRINPHLDYSPENVRWATQKEQCNNRRLELSYKEIEKLKLEILELKRQLAAKT